MGYSGWDAGQLEKEIENGDWMIMPSSENLIFSKTEKDKWTIATSNLDINFKNINPQNLNERLVFLDDIKGFDGSLSGRLNTDINNLGRLESLSLDLNVGESILSHKIDYLDNTLPYLVCLKGRVLGTTQLM